MDTSYPAASSRRLLLRYRGRAGLIQRELAAPAGVSRGPVQGWEAGLNYPTAERLDITGLTGITAAQRTALWALGAVQHKGMAIDCPRPEPDHGTLTPPEAFRGDVRGMLDRFHETGLRPERGLSSRIAPTSMLLGNWHGPPHGSSLSSRLTSKARTPAHPHR